MGIAGLEEKEIVKGIRGLVFCQTLSKIYCCGLIGCAFIRHRAFGLSDKEKSGTSLAETFIPADMDMYALS